MSHTGVDPLVAGQSLRRCGGSSGKRRKDAAYALDGDSDADPNATGYGDRLRGNPRLREGAADSDHTHIDNNNHTHTTDEQEESDRTKQRAKYALSSSDPDPLSVSHHRGRSKRVSRGSDSATAEMTFAGLEEIENGPKLTALTDITNKNTSVAGRRSNKVAHTTQNGSAPVGVSTRRTRSAQVHINTRQKQTSCDDQIAINLIPSPMTLHDRSFSSLHGGVGVGEDLDSSMESAYSSTSVRGLDALRINHEEHEESHFMDSDLSASIASQSSTFHLNNTITSNHHDESNLSMTMHDISSASSSSTSFAAEFAAATAGDRVNSSSRRIREADIAAPDTSPAIDHTHATQYTHGHAHDQANKTLHVPSSTPEVVTTAASTLTQSMAHSLQLTNHSTAVPPVHVTDPPATLTLPPTLTSTVHPNLIVVPSVPVVPGDELPPPPATLPASTAPTNAWTAHVLHTASAAAPTPHTTAQNELLSADVPLQEYNALILTHMLEVESKYLPNPCYMDQVQNDLSYVMRSILMDWLIEVSEEYQLCSQTMFLCINYVDRFLSIYPVDRAKLQLLGVTALLVASKYNEVRAPSIDEFIYISDATYSREQVLQMESALLNTLQFSLMVVTPFDISTRIVERMGREIVQERTEWLADLMMHLFILESHYLQYRPSVIAASAIFLALYTTHCNPWPAELEAACQLNVESIQMCVRAMHAAYLRMGPTGVIPGLGSPPLIAIKDKYSQPRFGAVAGIQPRLL